MKSYIIYNTHKFLFAISLTLFFTFGCGNEVQYNYSNNEIPEFPWPPPKESASWIVPSEYLLNSQSDSTCFKDVDKKLSSALNATGYYQKCYYSVPAGFAIVTRLERYNEDGSINETDERWDVEYKMESGFNFRNILKAIFTPNPGYFRVIVFIITPNTFTTTDDKPDRDEALSWLNNGVLWLPKYIQIKKFTEEHRCTALIYEFERYKNEGTTIFRDPGRLQGQTHLLKSKIEEKLRGEL